MTDFTPLRNRLSALRHRVLVTLAEHSEDGALDAGLIALVANIQTALAAVEETTKPDGLGDPVARNQGNALGNSV